VAGDEPTTAVLVERIGNLQQSVNEVKRDMATKGDQRHTDETLTALTSALALERQERIAADEKEASARTAAIKPVADRLQLVEDRQEARKWQFLIAIGAAIMSPIIAIAVQGFVR